jgi:leucyl/phenylalanyl-tRNA--protein transferase
MFHRERDASKVALVGLVELLRADGDAGRQLDVQWATEHLVSLGAIEVARPAYLLLLAEALDRPQPDFPVGPLAGWRGPGRNSGAASGPTSPL